MKISNGTWNEEGTRRWKTTSDGGCWVSPEAYERDVERVRRTNKEHVYLDNKYIGLSYNVGIPAGRYRTGDNVRIGVTVPLTREGYVYIVKHPDEKYDHLCKIGRSHDPDQRIGSGNTWMPDADLEVVARVKTRDCYELEDIVHKELKSRGLHHRKEWFEINQWHGENLILKLKREKMNDNASL